jgi:NADH dehydrogenase FAD-containing subunit
VCGGGATGIETAAEFAESYPGLEIQLITRDQFGMFLGEPVAAYMRQALERLGVVIRDRVVITGIRPHAITTSAGEIACDVCLWAGGFVAPPLAREAGVTVNERGQVLVDPFMRSISHPEIFAVGDAASPIQEPGVPVRMSAYAAAILGAHGADSLAAVLRGKAPQPLSFAYLGQGIALGRHDSIGLNNYPDDKPHWPYFTGRIGYEGREFFVRLLADAPWLERRWPGLFTWVGQGRYAAAQRRSKARPVDAPVKLA